jgi:hypothetical protein
LLRVEPQGRRRDITQCDSAQVETQRERIPVSVTVSSGIVGGAPAGDRCGCPHAIQVSNPRETIGRLKCRFVLERKCAGGRHAQISPRRRSSTERHHPDYKYPRSYQLFHTHSPSSFARAGVGPPDRRQSRTYISTSSTTGSATRLNSPGPASQNHGGTYALRWKPMTPLCPIGSPPWQHHDDNRNGSPKSRCFSPDGDRCHYKSTHNKQLECSVCVSYLLGNSLAPAQDERSA